VAELGVQPPERRRSLWSSQGLRLRGAGKIRLGSRLTLVSQPPGITREMIEASLPVEGALVPEVPQNRARRSSRP
jgi:hypothetical protein